MLLLAVPPERDIRTDLFVYVTVIYRIPYPPSWSAFRWANVLPDYSRPDSRWVLPSHGVPEHRHDYV